MRCSVGMTESKNSRIGGGVESNSSSECADFGFQTHRGCSISPVGLKVKNAAKDSRDHFASGVSPNTMLKLAANSAILESLTGTNATSTDSRAFSSRMPLRTPSRSLPLSPLM